MRHEWSRFRKYWSIIHCFLFSKRLTIEECFKHPWIKVCKNLLHPSSVDPYFYVFIYLVTFHVFYWLVENERFSFSCFSCHCRISFFLFSTRKTMKQERKSTNKSIRRSWRRVRWKVSRHCSQLILYLANTATSHQERFTERTSAPSRQKFKNDNVKQCSHKFNIW